MDCLRFTWEDETSTWAGPTAAAGEMPRFRRALLVVLVAFSSLAAIGRAAQMLSHVRR